MKGNAFEHVRYSSPRKLRQKVNYRLVGANYGPPDATRFSQVGWRPPNYVHRLQHRADWRK